MSLSCASTIMLRSQQPYGVGGKSVASRWLVGGTVHNPGMLSPRERIELEWARGGRTAVVAGCVRLIHGDDSDTRLITVLGGPTARWGLEGDRADWFRVWAMRGLLWA